MKRDVRCDRLGALSYDFLFRVYRDMRTEQVKEWLRLCKAQLVISEWAVQEDKRMINVLQDILELHKEQEAATGRRL